MAFCCGKVDRGSLVFAAVMDALVVGDCDVWFPCFVLLGEMLGEFEGGGHGEVFGC